MKNELIRSFFRYILYKELSRGVSMKKILLSFAVCFFLVNNMSFASQGYIFTADDVQKSPTYTQSLQYRNMPYGEYLKFYNLNLAKIDAEFVIMSSSEEKKFLRVLNPVCLKMVV